MTKLLSITLPVYFLFISYNSFAQKSTRKDIVYSSPIYLDIFNPISLPDIDTSTIELSSEEGYISRWANSKAYLLRVFVPDSATVFGINKATKDTTYIIHFTVKKLPEKELVQPVIRLGDIKGSKTTAAIFRSQKEFRISKGFTFLGATIYFSGKGFFNAIQVRAVKDPSTTAYKDVLDSCQPGTTIIFDNVKFLTPFGKIATVEMPTLVLTENTADTLSTEEKPRAYFGELKEGRAKATVFKKQKEIKIPHGYQFKKAIIYFAGAGFPAVAVANLFTPELSPVKDLIERCQPGTTVILEKILVMDKNGKDKFLSNIGIILF